MYKLNLASENIMINPIDASQKRKILITDTEEVRPRGYDSQSYVKWLNFRYVELHNEMLPYHYVITSDGALFSAKADFVSTKVNLFSSHENDLIIYTEGSFKKYSDDQKNALVKVCSFLCQKYAIGPREINFFPYDILNDTSAEEQKNNIQLLVMNVLEQKNPINIVRNSFLREAEATNMASEKAEFISLNSEMTIKELSELTGIPQSVLLQQNEHLL
ncbi:MAG: hypothetical protein K0R00_171 [Herbinix sp.]|jgi:hypothetical protein|nr:hypothetical protein [Herbinix sp.]